MEGKNSDSIEDNEEMDIYGGLDESLCEKNADEKSAMSVTSEEDSHTSKQLSKIKTSSDKPTLDVAEDDKVMSLAHDEMALFDELLVAENEKRKEKIEQDIIEKKKLLEENEELKKLNSSLEERAQKLLDENLELKKQFSSLYNTSKDEIEKRDKLIADKDRKIAELESELHELLDKLYSRHYRDRKRNHHRSRHAKYLEREESPEPPLCNMLERNEVNLAATNEPEQKLRLEDSSESKFQTSENQQNQCKVIVEENLLNESDVPSDILTALAKFESQQTASLNSLKRAFSEYEKKNGLSTIDLKDSFGKFYENSACTEVPQSGLEDESVAPTNEMLFNDTVTNAIHENVENLHQSVSVPTGASGNRNAASNELLSRAKSVHRKRPVTRISSEDEQNCEDAKSAENTDTSTSVRNRNLFRKRRSPFVYKSPLKRLHSTSRSVKNRYLEDIRFFKPAPHKTPEKFPELLKNDALKIFRYQDQPVPFAIKRKLGLLRKKNSSDSAKKKTEINK